MNIQIAQSTEEPFSDEKLWGPKERKHKTFQIEKDINEEDGSWNLFWMIVHNEPLPLELQGLFTSVNDAVRAIETYLNQRNNSNGQ